MVRAATRDDAGDLARIHVETWHAAYPGIVPDSLLATMTLDTAVERWRTALPLLSPNHCLVAVEAGEDAAGDVTGFVRCGPSRDEGAAGTTGEVFSLYVHPASWAGGHGRSLLDAATGLLAGEGFTDATLWVLAANDRAQRFYRRCGWHPDGRTKRHHRDGAVLVEAGYRRQL
nr:N-acetyltransferase [Kineococcus siccus]